MFSNDARGCLRDLCYAVPRSAPVASGWAGALSHLRWTLVLADGLSIGRRPVMGDTLSALIDRGGRLSELDDRLAGLMRASLR